MKNLNQKTINKILAVVVVILIIVIGFMTQQKITEQARIDYYICYNNTIDSGRSYDKEELQRIKDICNGVYYD